MNFKNIRVYFKFTKSQRTGVLFLIAIIVAFQLAYFFVNIDSIEKESTEKQKWLSVQSEIDSLNRSEQKLVVKIYSFNPNFITDYKGYRLGMSVPEIDRLLAFRKKGNMSTLEKNFKWSLECPTHY